MGVFPNLGLQRVGAREFHLIAQAIEELDFHAVRGDLTGKVQQVALDSQLMLSERRLITHIRNRFKNPRADGRPGHIDADFGKLLLDAAEVEGRNRQSVPPQRRAVPISGWPW
jgi:hypothetical protein